RFPPSRLRPSSERPRCSNQSRYVAGIVSGIAAHNNAVAIAEAAARIRKPSHWPSPSKRKPVAVVLIGRVVADTIVAKKAGPDSKVAIIPAHFYLLPHRVEAHWPHVPAAAA